MRKVVAPLVLGLLVACSDSALTVPSEGLQLSSDRLAFAPTYVGAERTESVTIVSTSRLTQDVQLLMDGPFSVAGERVVLRGGERVELPVSFKPTAVGRVEGALRVLAPTGETVVALEGEGRTPPVCVARGDCVRVHVDLEHGTCVELAAPEGTPCEDACLVEASCRGGRCAGRPRSCADGDACTNDVCVPGGGCQNPVTTCAKPEDPCLIALCDATRGCVTTTVADGTPCGEQSCSAAHVCIAGVCTVRTLPDGARCGVESPCQAAGVCRDAQCLQPDPTPLSPLWSVPANSETLNTALFGQVDGHGNLYWVEYSPPPHDSPRFRLVSMTRDGAVRFRTDLARHAAVYSLRLAGELVVLSNWGSPVSAYHQGDGHLVWSINLSELQLGKLSQSHEQIVFNGVDTLYIGFYRAGAEVTVGILALALSTGEVRWSAELPRGTIEVRIHADQRGNLYGYSWHMIGAGVGAQLRSYAADGELRWSREGLSNAAIRGVLSGSLILSGRDLLETETGATRGHLQSQLPMQGPFGSGDAIVGIACEPEPLDQEDRRTRCFLDHHSLTTGARLSRGQFLESNLNPLEDDFPEPLHLTDGDSLLTYFAPQGRGTERLLELDFHGRSRFTCPLAPLPGTLLVKAGARWRTAFDRGRWMVQMRGVDGVTYIVAYDLPGLAPAAHGWSELERRER